MRRTASSLPSSRLDRFEHVFENGESDLRLDLVRCVILHVLGPVDAHLPRGHDGLTLVDLLRVEAELAHLLQILNHFVIGFKALLVLLLRLRHIEAQMLNPLISGYLLQHPLHILAHFFVILHVLVHDIDHDRPMVHLLQVFDVAIERCPGQLDLSIRSLVQLGFFVVAPEDGGATADLNEAVLGLLLGDE